MSHSHIYGDIVQAAKMIGAGCATIGVIGAGVGIVLFLEILLWHLHEIQL